MTFEENANGTELQPEFMASKFADELPKKFLEIPPPPQFRASEEFKPIFSASAGGRKFAEVLRNGAFLDCSH